MSERSDTDRMHAFDEGANVVIRVHDDGSCNIYWHGTDGIWTANLRAAIDAYLDAEQQSEPTK